MKKKRFLAVLLCAVMVMTLLPTTALAMQIFVARTPSGLITLDVEPTDQIETVKVKICNETSIPPEQQALYFAGILLEDGNMLQDYSIQKNMELNLVIKLTAPTGLAWDTTIPGKAKWTAVTNAAGYSVQLYKGGTAQGAAVSATGAEYDFTSAITQTGRYTFKVIATGNAAYADSAWSDASGGYDYTAPSITTTALPDASLGAGYGNGATLAASGTTPITWSLTGSLPPGLTLNAETGHISGIPTLEGRYTFTVTATNDVDSDSRELSITVTGIEYQITKGANGTWTKDSTSGLGFIGDADYSKFTSVMVDDSQIASDKYTVASGSTIVTLKDAYLGTLSAGQHTLRMNFTDGYAETQFTVNAASALVIPKTGDDMQAIVCLGALLTAGAGLVAGSSAWRRRQDG